MSDNQRRILLLIGIMLVSVTILLTWPSTVEDPTGDTVFKGEMWGDLRTEGEIWGEHKSELDYVEIGLRSEGGGKWLQVNVTNVSNVWLEDDHSGTNVSVPCENRSFVIITDNGRFEAYLSDLEFECEYLEFIGLFPGGEKDYSPISVVTSVEGHGYLVHGESWRHRWDISLRGCVVVVDGNEYRDIDNLFIPKDESPYMEVRGDIGSQGSIWVGGGLHPHVNGTLEVENFLHKKDGRSEMYRRIRFEGEDISIRTTGRSQSGTGGMFKWHDQWSIEVTISPDTAVEIEEASQMIIWFEALLIALLITMILYTFDIVERWRSKG